MKKLFCLMGGAMLIFKAQGQEPRTLTVGDTLPNLLFENIVNTQKDSIRLYNIEKPIIFDFFETHCGVCIQLLPFLNKLQVLNRDSLAIYIVANEPANIIRRFLINNPKARGVGLPFITSDTMLNAIFKHRTIPHEIWVGKDHVVKAITSYGYVNEKNVHDLISGAQLQLPIKNDYLKYDPYRSLVNYEPDKGSIFSSSLSGYIENLPKFYHKTLELPDGIHKKVVFTNSDLLTMIRNLVGYKFNANRVLLNVKDSSKLLHLGGGIADHWFLKNSYCYELTVPLTFSDSVINNFVLADLGRAFDMNIRVVKQEMPCYVLVRSGKVNINPATKGGKRISKLHPSKGDSIIMQNEPLASLVATMNSGDFIHNVPIIFDETGIQGNVDLKLKVSDVYNLAKISNALCPYGLSVIKTRKSIEMVVISDL